MAKWQTSGSSISVYVEFRKDGEFVIPDSNSIYLTIRGNNGVAIGGYNKVLQSNPGLSTWLLTVSGIVNTVVSGIESRYVLLEFTNGGVPCTFVCNYKLSPFLPILATPADVRNLLGVRDTELPDSEVDLYEAYFYLLRSNPLLASALVSTTDQSLHANKAIALQAALSMLPSMPVRAMKEESLSNAGQIRANIDWELLRASLEGDLGNSLGNMVLTTSVPFTYTPLFAVVTPTDPVTNA